MRITILGAGKQGTSIAQALVPGGHDITVIDNDPELIEKLESRMDIKCINADAEDIEVLKASKINKSDVLIATTQSDDKNAALCSIAKELGVKKCFARIRSVEKFDQMDLIKRAMKIDTIINPDLLCANEIYKNLTNRFSFGEGYKMINGMALIEFEAPNMPQIIGNAIKDSVNSFNGLLVVAISRSGKLLIPNGDTVFQNEDHIYAVGSRNNVMKMRDSIHLIQHKEGINRVMIAGGGKTSLFLSRQLINDAIDVTIIENSKNRAEHVAITLDKASVVYGDATDSELLFEEELENMDAFVACTGVDEENYMLAMYAKRQGVQNSIAKLTRSNYGLMLDNLGDITTINPVELCTAYVIRNISDDNSIVFSKLIQGQAEFMEVSVNESMPIRSKLIKDLSLPSGVLIAALFRDGDMITPTGNTNIEVGDRIIVLSSLSQIPVLQTLLKGSGSEEL